MVTILFVDDDPLMHRILVPRLQELSTSRGPPRVLGAHTPTEAMELVAQVPEGVLVVLTDFNLKAATNGLQLLRQVREARPDALRILLSGYSLDQLEDIASGGDADAVIEKPIILDELLAPLAQLIEARLT